MVSLHCMHYNFCRIHKTLENLAGYGCEGFRSALVDVEDVVDLIDARAEPPKRPATYRKHTDT